jgi:hypothetical protein
MRPTRGVNLCDNKTMPLRWNTWALVQAVRLDYEKTTKERPVRLAAPTARVGDPVRIGISGMEIEGRITDASTSLLHVKVNATPLKMKPIKRSRTA